MSLGSENDKPHKSLLVEGGEWQCPLGRGTSMDPLLLSGVGEKGSILSLMSFLGSNQILQSLSPPRSICLPRGGRPKNTGSGLQAGVSLPRKCGLSSVKFWQAPDVSGGRLVPCPWGFIATEDRGARPALGGQGGSGGWVVGELEAGRRGLGVSWWAARRGPSLP